VMTLIVDSHLDSDLDSRGVIQAAETLELGG
jgi:hypothetical protein